MKERAEVERRRSFISNEDLGEEEAVRFGISLFNPSFGV